MSYVRISSDAPYSNKRENCGEVRPPWAAPGERDDAVRGRWWRIMTKAGGDADSLENLVVPIGRPHEEHLAWSGVFSKSARQMLCAQAAPQSLFDLRL